MSDTVLPPPDLSALSSYAPELAATMASIASDLALIIDRHGTIISVATLDAPLSEPTSRWIGRKWVDTVTQETRRKIEMLLDEARSTGVSRRREVNHPFTSGGDIPMAYAAIQLGTAGPVLAAGRDLRAIAAIQQRFVQSQQEMEKDYWVKRREEARHRILFHVATDAVVVVDAQSGLIVEANPAAARLFGMPRSRLLGRDLRDELGWQSPPAIAAMLSAALESDRGGEMPARLAGNLQPLLVAATPFRGLTGRLLLVRVRAARAAAEAEPNQGAQVDSQAVVVTDSSGRILMSNAIFAAWCEVSTDALLQGEPLARWLETERSSVAELLASVRAAGVCSDVSSLLVGQRSRRSARLDVSAALITDADQERIGFVLTERELAPVLEHRATGLDELVGQIGSTGLSELVAAGMDLAERAVIQHAWSQTAGSLEGAARLLRISTAELQQRIGALELVLGAFGTRGPLPSKPH